MRRIVESVALTHVALPITNIHPAIQQDAVVGQENPIDPIYAQDLHATAAFVALTRHVYGPIPMPMLEASWKRLSATD
jgi:TRAP-type C4-dicarboxylate transport system substrate-binding protein